MKKYTETEVKIINVHIGLKLRLARLKKNLSQQDLSLLVASESVTIGRLERGEHFSNWALIFKLANTLNVTFIDLFQLKDREVLINLKNECFNLETKLNESKRRFYAKYEDRINALYCIE
ncbi:helix-turn-helix transcriptional regulator [Myroides odoratimimus]|uniref:helix-turn-helix transcriptional regulator n=1 Tax=Myroides odoratimimus TaxID=76832 RepID=UPI002DB88C73|nr:helix-turn-helix transcriptional regulator [Myroides odoratimimus]MEC4036814.1 helix-turn-helix transcriptional regulator [Myroides odoratimimus]